MDNNMVSKISVEMFTTNIHLLLKIQSHLQKCGLYITSAIFPFFHKNNVTKLPS